MLLPNRNVCTVCRGWLHTYDGLTLFVAMTDPAVSPIVHWLFQKHHHSTLTFAIDNDFTFILVDAGDAPLDMFHYSVSYGDVTVPLSILGIDTVTLCGPLSNIDLIYFV